jgi:ATP-dependent exoDNAse (exonuclease V) beta subunit
MDIKETFLFDKSFGFITPYFDGRKTDTIDKLLYKNQYLKEDLSERIRLLYVAMTRAREKMYFIMPSYENLKVVANPFLFSSLTDFIAYYYDEAVKKYVKEVKYDDMVNKDYLEFKTPYLSRILQSEDKYSYDEITRNPKELEAGKISKKIDKLIDLDTSENIAFGTRMHNILQSVDLKSKDISSFSLTSKEKRLLDNLLKLDCFANLDNANVYKELEFIYNDLENSYHGIIDLLIEYDDHFEIIDYKLSDVNKEEYIRQLTVYKNYLNQISNKEVKTYLLSITKCTLNEVIVVE